MILLRSTLRHLGALTGPAVLLSVVLLATTAAVTGLPRLVDATAYDDLRVAVDDLPPAARDLEAEASGALPADPPGAAPLSTVDADLDRVAAALVAQGVGRPGEPGHVVRLPSVEAERAGIRRRVEFVALDNPGRIRLVQGRLPRAPDLTGPGEIRVEVVLSRETATRMKTGVGGSVPLLTSAEGGDAAILASVLGVPFGQRAARVVVVGVFEAVDPQDTAWDHATSILRPFVFDDGNGPLTVTAAAVADPALFRGASASTTVQAWLPLSVDGLALQRPEDVATGLRRFMADTTLLSDPVGASPIRLTFGTDTAGAIDAALVRAATTRAVLATVLAGPIGVALVVLLVGLVLLRLRQVGALHVISSRGASAGQLVTLGLLQAALVAVPAVLLGAALGRELAPAPPGEGGSSWPVLAALVLVPMVVLPLLLVTGRARAAGGPRAARRRRALRLLGEAVALVVAALCVVALGSGASAGEVDPLLALTPIALGVAAALVARRVVEAVLAAVAALARRRPGLAAIGAVRARRAGADAWTLALAATLAVAVGVLALVVAATLDAAVAQAARDAAREGVRPDVGADSPSLRGLRAALLVTGLLAAALVVVAGLLSAAVGHGARERLLATLDVVGASGRQRRGLALWEVLPVALAGVLTGLLVGLLPILPAALDLTAYAGLETAPDVRRPWAAIAALSSSMLVVLVGVRLLAVAAAGRADPARLFRDPAPGGS